MKGVLRILEEALPIEAIWLQYSERPASRTEPFESAAPAERVEIITLMRSAFKELGIDAEEAQKKLGSMELFCNWPELMQSSKE